jgi:hypothetical protein
MRTSAFSVEAVFALGAAVGARPVSGAADASIAG